MTPQVVVVMPALDEQQAIGGVLASLDRALVSGVVVADNGSRDRTAEIARAHGATVVHVAERGYGAACWGALQVLPDTAEIVVFMDADGSDDPADMRQLVQPIAEGRADLVIGSRVLGRAEQGALTPQQRFGNRVATLLVRLIWGHAFTDLGPFRAIRRDVLLAMDMRDRRYGWTIEMQVRALRMRARVLEVPAAYRRRIGQSKISGTLLGSLKAGWWILATIARHAWR